jgi:LmbE family N-acetylglucosaminyl deacetylase
MLDFILDLGVNRPLRVLCVGAHCDDIEIGCGATLHALQSRSRPVVVDWAVLSGTEERRKETRRAMHQLLLPQCQGDLRFGDYPDGRFPAVYAEIKDFCEALKRYSTPDLVLCHEREDRHQDHRIVNEMVWSTFRDQVVLEYEVPKWDGGLGQPNVYVAIQAADAEAKVDTLLKSYPSQARRDWFSRETFMALLRMRGLECRAPSGYAEAFYGRKLGFKAC